MNDSPKHRSVDAADQPGDDGYVAAQDPWSRFELDIRLGLTKKADSPRAMVPVLGAGANRHFLGPRAPAGLVGWGALLEAASAAEHLSLSGFGNSEQALIASWEALLLELADREGIQANEAELQLRKYIASYLAQAEAKARGTSGQSRGSPKPPQAVQDFLALGWSDVISLNFDSLLSSSPSSAWGSPGSKESITHRDFPKLRCELGASEGRRTRVWYPHGHRRRIDSLMLGIRSYGLRIGWLEARLRDLKREESKTKPEHPSQLDLQALQAGRRRATDWLAATLNAPLVLLGASVGPDEWSLWWFLATRARNHVRLPDEARPRVYRLTCDQDRSTAGLDAWRRSGLITIEDLHGGPTWEDAWNRFYRAASPTSASAR